jgi:hypothetical protein
MLLTQLCRINSESALANEAISQEAGRRHGFGVSDWARGSLALRSCSWPSYLGHS